MANFAAILTATAVDLVYQEREIPVPGPDEILVRNHAIAVNPIDWKRQVWGYAISSFPVILGSDVCGVVVKVGSSVTEFNKGDRVFGFSDSFFSGKNNNSAFQNYTILNVTAAARLPKGLSFEQGAMFPMAVATSAMSLFHFLGLPQPTVEGTSEVGTSISPAILVWGGASSVGSMTIQLARLSGLTVFATASEHHHAYLRSLGANEVVDYHSPSAIGDLVALMKQYNNPTVFGLDTVSDERTLSSITQVLAQSSDGKPIPKLAHLLPLPKNYNKLTNVDAVHVSGENILSERKDLSTWLYNKFLPEALERGTMVPSPKLRVVEGGLTSLQKAMDILRAGVSGEKLVITIDQAEDGL